MGEVVVKAPKGRRSRRRWALLTGLLAVLLIGVLAATQLPGILSSKSSPPEPTIWQKITSGIKDGAVPKDVALEAFAYLYKVDIPGVTVPKGVEAGDRPTSGSGALRWVKAVWGQLTAAQQAVITDVMAPGPNDVVVSMDATTGKVTPISGSDFAARPNLGLALAVGPRALSGGMAQGDAPSSQVQDAIEAELFADIQHIGTKLGLPVIDEGFGLWKNITLDISEKSGNGTLLTAQALLNKAGHYNPCAVTAYKESWENETGPGVSPTFHVLMTHEVIHCYQHVVEGDVDTANAVPPWITEGTAIYLAASDTGTAEPMIPSMWTKGYFFPETALTNRSYDAFGYYSLLQHQGRDIWARIVPAWKAASTSAQRSNAFIAVLQGDDPDVRNVWASSYLRETTWGDPWIAYGFGIPDTAQVIRHQAQALADPGWTGTLLSRSNTVLEVGQVAGDIAIVTTSGLASVHDQASGSALDFQSRSFCVTGNCTCPDNTPRAGQEAADQHLGMPFEVAFNAPEGGSSYSIVGMKLEEFCGKKPTPKPSGGPCAGSCGSSNGDPHLQTINSYRYDFQGAGEFALLRSADGNLEIQAREEPFVGSKVFGGVATNTAIAAKVGAHRVGIYAPGDTPLQARVDGKVIDGTTAVDLGGGAQIAPYSHGFEIDFPDGTKLWTLSVGKWGINAIVQPSAALKTGGVGLLGPIVPGGLGVPALPDGTRLPAAKDRHARHAVVYGQFADAWRVTDSTTLFDYDSGKSTAAYTQKDFPSDTADITFSDLTPEQQSAGRAACGSVTDQNLQESCVFDVGVSGDSGFAQSYVATQVFYDSGILAPTPAPLGTGIVITPPPGKVSGAVAIAPAAGLGGYAVGPDNKLYVSLRVAADLAALAEVDPTTGVMVSHITVPDVTEVHVAGASVWLPGLKVDSRGNNCSVTRFDAQSLSEQATIAIPCTFIGGPAIVSDGSAVWFVDVSKYDGATNKGAVLTRIDPATNAFGPSVDLPFINGYRADSRGALFYFDTTAETGYYQLKTGDTAMTKLAPWSAAGHTGGIGMWMAGKDGNSALYYSTAGGPQTTLTIDGTLVAGDDSAAYVERNTSNGTELWRYPIDGSAATQIGTAPTVDNESLGYFADPQSIMAPNGLIKLWLPQPSGSNPRTLYYQWVPLP